MCYYDNRIGGLYFDDLPIDNTPEWVKHIAPFDSWRKRYVPQKYYPPQPRIVWRHKRANKRVTIAPDGTITIYA